MCKSDSMYELDSLCESDSTSDKCVSQIPCMSWTHYANQIPHVSRIQIETLRFSLRFAAPSVLPAPPVLPVQPVLPASASHKGFCFVLPAPPVLHLTHRCRGVSTLNLHSSHVPRCLISISPTIAGAPRFFSSIKTHKGL